MRNTNYRHQLLANCRELLTRHPRDRAAAPANRPGNANRSGGMAVAGTGKISGFGAKDDDWLGAEAYIEPMFKGHVL